MKDEYRIVVKWGISRGYETAGYTTCSIYVNEKKCGSCNGGGYDLEGTSWGIWMEKEFNAEIVELIKKSEKENYYGAKIYNGKASLDGGCGLSCMRIILNALGYDITCVAGARSSKQTVYFIQKEK